MMDCRTQTVKLLLWQSDREQRTLFTRPMHAGLVAGRFPTLTRDWRHFQTTNVLIRNKKNTKRFYYRRENCFKFTGRLDVKTCILVSVSMIRKMVATGNSEILAPIYQITHRHIPNERKRHLRNLHTAASSQKGRAGRWAMT